MKAILEAEQFDGPSIIIAYSQCIAHGYDLRLGMQQAKKATDTGYWPMYRFNPANFGTETPVFSWDSPEATMGFGEFTDSEARYKMLSLSMPAEAERLQKLAQQDNARRLNDILNLKNV
jgi:pyruvate-ferredoxin/flavodoxin oxidoreductase